MADIMREWTIQFEHPIWLLGLLLAVPVVWLGLRSLAGLGPWRQRIAITIRVIVIGLIVVLLAGPQYTRTYRHLTVLAVLDRSQSVPRALQEKAMAYLNATGKDKTKAKEDRIGVVWAGDMALIHSLPNTEFVPVGGVPSFSGDRTDLEAAIRMALAVLPSDTAKRIVLISDGNENLGDLRGVARIARANRIPIDCLSLNYNNDREVIVERLVVPAHARTGQTVSARCVLRSTSPASGRLVLEDNGRMIDLDPNSPEFSAPVNLKAGLNVTTVLLPIPAGGVHRFSASFIPNGPKVDTIAENNRGMGVTFVVGKGKIMVCDADGKSARTILDVLTQAQIEVEYRPAEQFPSDLVGLMDYDAVLLVNTPNSSFSLAQQQLMVRYVHDLGGGLVMVGGPDALGAGGWESIPRGGRLIRFPEGEE